jgi:hypothetical protein
MSGDGKHKGNRKMAVFWLLRRVVWERYTDVLEVLAASIIRVISQIVDNPEDSHLHSRRRANLKSHKENT